MAKQCGGRDVGALRGVRPVAGARRLGGLVDGLWGALLPVQCAGCLAWDEVLCPSCRSLAGAPALPTAVESLHTTLRYHSLQRLSDLRIHISAVMKSGGIVWPDQLAGVGHDIGYVEKSKM